MAKAKTKKEASIAEREAIKLNNIAVKYIEAFHNAYEKLASNGRKYYGQLVMSVGKGISLGSDGLLTGKVWTKLSKADKTKLKRNVNKVIMVAAGDLDDNAKHVLRQTNSRIAEYYGFPREKIGATRTPAAPQEPTGDGDGLLALSGEVTGNKDQLFKIFQNILERVDLDTVIAVWQDAIEAKTGKACRVAFPRPRKIKKAS